MNLFSPKRSPALAVLLTSVWLIAVDNGQFWQLIAQASTGWVDRHLWFMASIVLTGVALVNLVLTLLTFGRSSRYVLSALLCLSAAAAHFMDQYGVMLDPAMISNIFETDQSEAMELVGGRLIVDVLLLGVLPAVVIWRMAPKRQPASEILAEKAIVLGLSLLALAVLVAPFSENYISLGRQHRELRYLFNPVNYISSAYSAASDLSAKPGGTVAVAVDAHKGARWANLQRPTVGVLVIGETARADSFSLGQYARDTNPRLADEQVIYFSNVSACGTSTRQSLPCMFSDLDRADYSRDIARNREGLLEVLDHAGIKTLWLDNNSGCKGVCRHTATRELSDSSVDGVCTDGDCLDAVLLEELGTVLGNATSDTVIVLHQNGSHGPSYFRRYPAEFRQFEPDCRSDEFADCSREQIINSYDNTIYYTDFILSRIIDLLDSHAEKLDSFMLYVSDHGESLGEYGLYLHGAPYFIAPAAQTHVPMILWMSAGYQQDFQIDRACLINRHANPISHDYLFHSMLGFLNIMTTAYDSTLDISSACSPRPMLAGRANNPVTES